MGVYAELVFGSLMPRLGSKDPADYVDCVKELGAEHIIMSTDLFHCRGGRHMEPCLKFT